MNNKLENPWHSLQRETTQHGDGRVKKPAEGMHRCHPLDADRVAAANLPGQRQRRWRHPRGSHSEDSPPGSGSPTRGPPMWVCFSPKRPGCFSRGRFLEKICGVACSVQLLGLGAAPARCSEQVTRYHNSWQQSTSKTCSDGFRRWSAFTRCMSMQWLRMMPTTNSFWWLRGGNRPGAAHLVAGAAGTLI